LSYIISLCPPLSRIPSPRSPSGNQRPLPPHVSIFMPDKRTLIGLSVVLTHVVASPAISQRPRNPSIDVPSFLPPRLFPIYVFDVRIRAGLVQPVPSVSGLVFKWLRTRGDLRIYSIVGCCQVYSIFAGFRPLPNRLRRYGIVFSSFHLSEPFCGVSLSLKTPLAGPFTPPSPFA